MSNDIFLFLLNQKIDLFIQCFVYTSTSLFYKNNILIHPGEMGKYREKAFIELIKLFIPNDLDISDGFIITARNNRSKQLDIIVFDRIEMPLLINDISTFYTVENVLSIGEIKSELSKTDFKEALIKLSNNKKLQNDIEGIDKTTTVHNLAVNHIISFLVCKKLTFNLDTINFDEIYDGIEPQHRHNAVLSIEDGLFIYGIAAKDFPPKMRERYIAAGGNIVSSMLNEYPVQIEKDEIYVCSNEYIKIKSDDKYAHIKGFIKVLSSALKFKKRFAVDFLLYSDLPIVSILK